MVGFGAGGTVDTIARIVAQAIGPILGQSVIVENRPGGSGSIAANAVVQAPADGHTLLFGIFSHAVAPALMKLNYDTIKDLDRGVAGRKRAPLPVRVGTSRPITASPTWWRQRRQNPTR